MNELSENTQDAKRPVDRLVIRELNHTHCHDCGRFLKKELWVQKDHGWKKHALCGDCLSNYDSPYDY